MFYGDTFYAWAIDYGEGFIGRYWWFNHKSHPIPPHIEGCKIALFKTRKLARENLPSVKDTYPQAKVSQVRLKVERV